MITGVEEMWLRYSGEAGFLVSDPGGGFCQTLKIAVLAGATQKD